MLVLAADHLIKDNDAFRSGIHTAVQLANEGKLVTFGIVPTHAETGYGYIEKGSELPNGGYIVRRFVEKPDIGVARDYVTSGNYCWNSGMFMFRASRYLEELKQHQPIIFSVCEDSLKNAKNEFNFIRVDHDIFLSCPNDSIDYAVMEKTSDAVMVPLDAGWNDIGSWSAVWEINTKDANDNVFIGDVMAQGTHNTYIQADSRLVAALGVNNLVIIETKDAVLVTHRDNAQEVKIFVDQMKLDKRIEHIHHREVYRPWGVYDSIDNGPRYQVKRITVNPGGKLSVQMHHHRAEHWIVVSGTAKVTNGEQTYLVTENQSTYIPIGQVHALENPGVIPLELIEVQSGTYLGEDDIVRFEDKYGRS